MIEIKNGNVLDELKKLESESVDSVITSPPYYGLRSYVGSETIWGGVNECNHVWERVEVRFGKDHQGYNEKRSYRKFNNGGGIGKNRMRKGVDNFQKFDDPESYQCSCGAWKGQLGLEPNHDMYIEHLMLISDEIMRVLKPTGTVFWNMGDTYSGSGGAGGDYNKGGLREGQPRYRQGFSDIKKKSLMMIPERFAIKMIEHGWILRNKIVWYKRNALPTSIKDRVSVKWENVFFFVKSGRYFFNKNGLRGDVWDIPNKQHRFAHFAVFPESLIKQIMEIGSYEGSTVLDPFAGSGTTGVVAKKNNRNAILIEIVPEYVEIMKNRISEVLG